MPSQGILLSVKPLTLLALLLALAGCASDPAPVEQLGLTEQAIEQARAVGATQTHESFSLALEKQRQAQADMLAKAYKSARLSAEQAELDARLAEAQVLSAKTRDQVVQQTARIERLRQQLKAAQ
jgi:hypothetical protein